jgi:hypothetical protein
MSNKTKLVLEFTPRKRNIIFSIGTFGSIEDAEIEIKMNRKEGESLTKTEFDELMEKFSLLLEKTKAVVFKDKNV